MQRTDKRDSSLFRGRPRPPGPPPSTTMGGDDFFDDFGKGEGLFTSEEDHSRIRELLLREGGDGDNASLATKLAALLTELCASRYATLEAAQAAHPIDPYLRALRDPAALEAMRREAAAAAKCAEDNAKGETAAAGKGQWEPPPEDEDPETAQDME